MSTFYRCATNTLQFLQVLYRVVPSDTVRPGEEADVSQIPRDISKSNFPYGLKVILFKSDYRKGATHGPKSTH